MSGVSVKPIRFECMVVVERFPETATRGVRYSAAVDVSGFTGKAENKYTVDSAFKEAFEEACMAMAEGTQS